jgi:hypothetical protein
VSDSLEEYRKHLVLAEQKAQEDYDKTILSLSGGALGISFAFIDKMIGTGPVIQPGLLFLAWVSWGTSVIVVLASFFFSQLALRQAIRQVDTEQIYIKRPGGFYSITIDICNGVGGFLFFAGVILIIIFVHKNLGVKYG